MSTHCNTLQHTATHHNTPQPTAPHRNAFETHQAYVSQEVCKLLQENTFCGPARSCDAAWIWRDDFRQISLRHFCWSAANYMSMVSKLINDTNSMVQTLTHTFSLTRTHTCAQTHTNVHTQKHTHTHIHARTYMHAHTHTRTRARTHTHLHTHIHT